MAAEEVFFQYGSSGSSLSAGTRQGGRTVCISFVPSEVTHTTADSNSNNNNNNNNNNGDVLTKSGGSVLAKSPDYNSVPYSRVLLLRRVPDFMIPSELISYFIGSLSDIASIRICEYAKHTGIPIVSAASGSNTDPNEFCAAKISNENTSRDNSNKDEIARPGARQQRDDFIAIIEFRSIPSCVEFYNSYKDQILSSVGSVVTCDFQFVQELDIFKSDSSDVTPFFSSQIKGSATSSPRNWSYSRAREIEAQTSAPMDEGSSDINSNTNDESVSCSSSSNSSSSGSSSSIHNSKNCSSRSGSPSFNEPDNLNAENCSICLSALFPRQSANDIAEKTTSAALFTTFCNHTFHVTCLHKNEDPRCPICRYQHDSSFGHYTCCVDCPADEPMAAFEEAEGNGGQLGDGEAPDLDLWMCVVCGYVGCGSRVVLGVGGADHIRKHFKATSHCLMINVSRHTVWDFAGDGYAHRVALNMEDDGALLSKLVEVNPTQYGSFERSNVAPLSSQSEEFLVHKKLEVMALHYNQVLMWQFQQSRSTFESRLSRLRRFALEEGQTSRELGSASSTSTRWADAIGKSLNLEKDRISRQLNSINSKIEELKRDKLLQADLSRAVLDNVVGIDRSLETARSNLQKAEKEYREKVSRLELEVQAVREKLK